MKAIIPAAGLGTRFLPMTKAVPKEMLPVGGKPAIQWVVEEALKVSDEVVIVNSQEKHAIVEHFSPNKKLVEHLRSKGKDALADATDYAGGLSVSYVYQEEAKGLGDAVYCAYNKIDGEAFFVLLGDVLVPEFGVLERMKEVSDEHGGASVIAVMPVPDDEVNRFGIMGGEKIADDVWKVDTLVEKPALQDAPSNLSIFGRYLLTPKVMELLSNQTPSVGGEIQLTDAMIELLKSEEMYAVVVDETSGLDTGTPESWLYANNVLAK